MPSAPVHICKGYFLTPPYRSLSGAHFIRRHFLGCAARDGSFDHDSGAGSRDVVRTVHAFARHTKDVACVPVPVGLRCRLARTLVTAGLA
jgi:hypothetical protein